ncbi:3-oxoacyl-[acyl-carrier-protein] synthase III C-terminal domain-containing protein [Pigmentibacter sp. JX0631]|uniref:3-oxoacyl-[acyl-carrier-protein] synthase III C-terminal domain-containing protein n=1 Tax=Pigmentibacter sp. JX0631 TaxID=2976982 RepID=UPI0024696D41|nr:3-oxoacyl-[acyl-carrier-protein] synthase III C-terminal domain-containing protein [Pigmentibacter sp. JX0631]WGL60978.1 3-oxoacyl-[acyl-carrier-protein] synthase III C-terminal domain-containing protein [Pigmentibacter sp. JX0631]
MNYHSVILCQFDLLNLKTPIDQKLLNFYKAKIFAKNYCSKEKVTDPQKIEQIYKDVFEKFSKYAISEDRIQKMQNVMLDTNPENFITEDNYYPELFPNLAESPLGIDIYARSLLFNRIALNVLNQFYPDDLKKPDDIIHVTNTGYLSPGPVQTFVDQKQWFNTCVTHSYQMGCYGAFPAVRMASGFLFSSWNGFQYAKKKLHIDIVHTEVFSLHTNVDEITPENIINMTLFGDGFVKYSAYESKEFENLNTTGLKILTNYEEVFPNSSENLYWIPNKHHFYFYLSKNVPHVIKNNILNFVINLCDQIGINFLENKNNFIYAVHPGGPKIVQYVQEMLELTDDQMQLSRKTFFNHGNVSSSTIPIAWKDIVEDNAIPKGQKIITIGFGPGITASGLIFEKV